MSCYCKTTKISYNPMQGEEYSNPKKLGTIFLDYLINWSLAGILSYGNQPEL